MRYLKKGEEILPVMECYAYRYDYGKGKTVLRVKCNGETCFSDIQKFFEATNDYEYYEGNDGQETLKTIYTRYGADIDIHYQKTAGEAQADNSFVEGTAYFDIEVLRDPSLEAILREMQQENSHLKNALVSLEQNNLELGKYAATLEADLTNAQIALVGLYEDMGKLGNMKGSDEGGRNLCSTDQEKNSDNK